MTVRSLLHAVVSVGITILATLLTPPVVHADTLPNGLAVSCN